MALVPEALFKSTESAGASHFVDKDLVTGSAQCLGTQGHVKAMLSLQGSPQQVDLCVTGATQAVHRRHAGGCVPSRYLAGEWLTSQESQSLGRGWQYPGASVCQGPSDHVTKLGAAPSPFLARAFALGHGPVWRRGRVPQLWSCLSVSARHPASPRIPPHPPASWALPSGAR